MPPDQVNNIIAQIGVAVAKLEDAERRAASHCAECGAAKTLNVETARERIVSYARALKRESDAA